MCNQVGLRELRHHASAVLKRVRAGESVEVTDHGHPVARIVPLRASTLEQLVIDGRASDVSGDLIDLVEELGLPQQAVGHQPVSEALDELRADER